jgi:hypothetical protein
MSNKIYNRLYNRTFEQFNFDARISFVLGVLFGARLGYCKIIQEINPIHINSIKATILISIETLLGAVGFGCLGYGVGNIYPYALPVILPPTIITSITIGIYHKFKFSS